MAGDTCKLRCVVNHVRIKCVERISGGGEMHMKVKPRKGILSKYRDVPALYLVH